MQTVLVVSPHLDDAVLSCGQLLAALPRGAAVVATVFAGTPEGIGVTDFDTKCGFRSSAQAMQVRRHEDHRAVSLLGGRQKHLGFLDQQYEPNRPTADDIASALEEVVVSLEDVALIVGPLGLKHEDHELVSEGFLRLAERFRTAVPWLYEELPYRVQWPEDVPGALERVAARFRPTLEALGGGSLVEKAKAVRCYGSQQWGLDGHSHLVPERYWLLHAKEREE